MQATFTALNIEYDLTSDAPEVDDTKELQVEEALKLYQTALKYHSEGPPSYDSATDAYTELFKSDIFQYPESQSLFRRIELYGPAPEWEDLDLVETGPVQLGSADESAPNTLPQILHLSYKNNGIFLLDKLQFELQRQSIHADGNRDRAFASAKTALRLFAEALDKDDTDLDLWGSSAGVASLIGSQRLSRYCLEAVLDDEYEGFKGVLSLPGLEEGYAIHELRKEVEKVQDDLSLSLSPLSRLKKKHLSNAILQRLNPYKMLRFPDSGTVALARTILPETGGRYLLRPGSRSWIAIGDSLLRQFQNEQNGFGPAPGAAIGIDVPPPDSSDHGHVVVAPEPQPAQQNKQAKELPEPEAAKEVEANGDPKDDASHTLADIEMTESPQETSNQDVEKNDVDKTGTEIQAPSEPNPRKRDSESAGLPENEDGGRGRSKRLRARESVVEKSGAQDASKSIQAAEDRLQPFIYADQILFETIGGLYDKIELAGFGTVEAIKATVQENAIDSPTTEDFSLSTPIKDIHAVAESCAPEVVNVLLNPDMTDQLQSTAQSSGLNAFLGYSKASSSKSKAATRFPVETGLDKWLAEINGEWMSTPEIALLWVERLLKQSSSGHGATVELSSYRRHHWSEDLKRVVVQLLVHLDERFFASYTEQITNLDRAVLDAQSRNESYKLTFEDNALIEMLETFFELHLDVYSLIKQPSSGVDPATQISQNDRLERWSSLAHEAMEMRATILGQDPLDELSVRHLWATAFHLGVADDVTQDHVLVCMNQLKILLQTLDGTLIELQNNAVMPELSVAAIEGELNRIRMKDFFAKVFDDSEKDPVTTIESLEPILELPFAQRLEDSFASADQLMAKPDDPEANDESTSPVDPDDLGSLEAMSKYLESGSVWPRLHLWRRLREAYEQIDYAPKVVSCYMRCIELLTNELKSGAYHNAPREQRYYMLLSWFRLIDEYLVKILAKTQAVTGTALNLDCVDEDQLRSILVALGDVMKLLHTFFLYEDNVRVGNVAGPMFEGKPKPSFPNVAAKLHDIALRVWMLQYHLFKEAIVQESDRFTNPLNDRFEYLRATHYVAGVRGFCKGTNTAFLRMIKEEFLQMSTVEGCDLELSQVLYDLYGLKCCANVADLTDHGSTAKIETLTKKSALKLLDFLMAQAKTVPAKDLPKLELKASIDKVHGALGRPKSSEDLASNKRLFLSYIKSAINPLELYKCLKGLSPILAKSVSNEEAVAAAKGWYSLMANIALNKYLAQKQKNVQAPPIEDLQIAISFFIQDLEYSMGHWETWYGLAQCYDLQLEEMVLWSAEKINNSDHNLAQTQRFAIHCYTMATANSFDIADKDEETSATMAKLYSDFGTRIYSSSRQPYSMAAFELRDTEMRFLSKLEIQNEPIKTSAFSPLTEYTAWKFAAALYRRSIARAPDHWWSHYMLGKCLWKMYTADESVRNLFRVPDKPNIRPEMNDILEAFISAIEALPQKRDSRKEPILEPHYKIVSIVHKLVQRKDMEPATGAEALQVSEFLREVGKEVDADSWESYVLLLLKTLRKADKSGWHHRMTARAAHVIYDDSGSAGDNLGAMGAKHELTQQIFTKTMAVQVWKPENERPGRHFVYTTRYTRFFIKLLVELDDRVNMEQLAKRVRRKPMDFYDHFKLWTELCHSYLKVCLFPGLPQSALTMFEATSPLGQDSGRPRRCCVQVSQL